MTKYIGRCVPPFLKLQHSIARRVVTTFMRLTKVLERQTGYLIFIRSNRVSFYKVQCAIFSKQFSILILHLLAFFPTFSRSGNAFTKFPTFSRLFPIVGTLRVNRAFATETVDSNSIPSRVKPKTIEIGIQHFAP